MTPAASAPATEALPVARLDGATIGRFVEGGRAYRIEGRPPMPWSNVISDGSYGAVWTDRGGAFSFQADSVLRRLTRWEMDLVLDVPRRTVFLSRDGAVRSLTPAPAPAADATHATVHGIGWTRYESEDDALAVRLTVLVLPGLDAEGWYVEATNRTSRPVRFRLDSYQEIALGSWPEGNREFHRLFIEAERRGDLLVFTKRIDPRPGRREAWNEPFDGALYHAASPAPSGGTLDRYAWLGAARDPARPAAPLEPLAWRGGGSWGDPLASLAVEGRVAPGATAEARFVTGFVGDAARAGAAAETALAVGRAEALRRVEAFWNGILGAARAETGDAAADLMADVWLPYQATSGRLFARCGLYQASGAIGYRDQLQDSMLFLRTDPARTEAQVVLHAGRQYRDGSSFHWWHPLTGTGSKTDCSDDYLWPTLVAAALCRERGDLTPLDRVVPFFDGGAAPLWDHIRRALERALGRRSPRGLPLIGDHDWNDGISSAGDEGRGESVWMGHFLVLLLCEASEIADRRGEDASAWRAAADEIAAAVRTHGWDGEWFLRATDDSGRPLGSRTNTEGRIYLNAQTWAAIGGTGTPEQVARALDAVERDLVKEYGVLLLAPAYRTPDPAIGYITRYAPGRRENGGVYTHAAVWAVRAFRLAGRNAVARSIFRSLLPPVRGADAGSYAAEPYVTPGNIDGPGTPTPGRGGWTWYTGSAAWLSRAWWEEILGIRAAWDGLEVAPILDRPFRATRPFRGGLYRIEAVPADDGTAYVEAGGREVAGAIVPVLGPGDHAVRVHYARPPA